MFGATLLAVTSGPGKGKEKAVVVGTSEGEKAKLMADLTECLRTYDILGLWRDAEDVIRREVVRDFVKKVRRIALVSFPSHLSRRRRPYILEP